MYRALVPEGNLYEWLWTLDQEMAEQTRAQGCPCGARLHRADYPRKPRGGPPDLDAVYAKRLSFCCAAEECRRRRTPPSVRFLGRRVFLGVVVVLASALHTGLAPRHVTRLQKSFDCELKLERRTLERWLTWWREQMPRSRFWQGAKGRLRSRVCAGSLPASLLEHLGLEPEPAVTMVVLLRLIAPLSIGPVVTNNEGGHRSAEDAD